MYVTRQEAERRRDFGRREFPSRRPPPRVAIQNLRVSLTVAGYARAQPPAPTKTETPPAKSKSNAE
jgi:hypothetical protein